MPVELGTITAPSGTLLVIDAGMLNLWSHDRPPLMPPGILDSAEATARANASVDFEIVGPDALALTNALDLQRDRRFLFDMPPTFSDHVAAKARELGLDARAVPTAQRITHRARVDLALERGNGAGDLQFHGMWCVAVTGVRSGTVAVTAELMPEGDPDEGRLRHATIECGSGTSARTEKIGLVAVDWARLLVIDVDALGAWMHDEPLDGRADCVFWGRDAATIAAQCNAPHLADGVFGWRDLPIDDAADKCDRVVSLRVDNDLRCAIDFRPHSHHYLLMEQVRASEAEAGMVDVGGARACGFMTRWGDGFFDVSRELDADGRLLRVRIDFATPERQALMRELNP